MVVGVSGAQHGHIAMAKPSAHSVAPRYSFSVHTGFCVYRV